MSADREILEALDAWQREITETLAHGCRDLPEPWRQMTIEKSQRLTRAVRAKCNDISVEPSKAGRHEPLEG
jgi:hypothetical protein